MTSRFAVMVGAALLGSVSSTAFAIDHACPPPGTEVNTTQTTGTPIRYESQRGLFCLRSRGGRAINSELGHFRFFARTAPNTDLYEKYVRAAAELWPIVPGKKITFVYTGVGDGSSGGSTTNPHQYEVTIVVDVQRHVKTAAGTFVAFPIQMTLKGLRSNHHVSTQTYYYAPDLAINVRYEYRLVSGTSSNQPTSWELTRIRTPGQGGSGGAGDDGSRPARSQDSSGGAGDDGSGAR